MNGVLNRWVKRVQNLPAAERERFLLTGSLLTASLVPNPRPVADLDYLQQGDFDVNAVVNFVMQVVTQNGADDVQFLFTSHTLTAPYDTFPGVRCELQAVQRGRQQAFQLDFFAGEPLSQAPQSFTVLGIPGVQTCSPLDLWAWKLHGLIEFGAGTWRSKDLFDLACLLGINFDPDELRAAVLLAFNHRRVPLETLAPFVLKDDWGAQDDGAQAWTRNLPGVPEPDFIACRERVRQKIRELWPDRDWLASIEVTELPEDVDFLLQEAFPPDDSLHSIPDADWPDEVISGVEAALPAELPDDVLDDLAARQTDDFPD